MNDTASNIGPSSEARESARAGAGAWAAVAVVAGGLFLAVMSTTLVSVALPTIGRDLHAGVTDLQWIVDAYVLIYASLLVAGGVIGDRRGRKSVFLLGVALFGSGAVVCGLAPSVAVLLAGRVLQGLGPALLIPGSLTIIRATFADPRKRAAAIGLWSMASGLSLAVGPTLGGLIVGVLGWRWVFLFNGPLAILLLVLAIRYLPRLAPIPSTERFDRLGAILTTAAIAAITFAVIHGQVAGLGSATALTAFAAGAIGLALLVAWERRRGEPLIDVRLFLSPRFTAVNVAALIVFFAFVGAIVYFSAYFQQVQGRSPIEAGLDVSAIGVAFAVAAPLSGRLVGRAGPLWPMLSGLLVAGVATLGLLRLEPHTGMGTIWWNFALLGAGIGACLTPMTHIAVAAVDTERAGMASALHNALRQVGQVFGVAVLGLLVYARLPHQGSAGALLDPTRAELFVRGLHDALWVSGLALLAAAALVALLYIRDPSRASSRREPDPASLAAPGPPTRRHRGLTGRRGTCSAGRLRGRHPRANAPVHTSRQTQGGNP